jgi:hypothetical protein
VDWIGLAQDSDKWRSRVAIQLVASQVVLNSIELLTIATLLDLTHYPEF